MKKGSRTLVVRDVMAYISSAKVPTLVAFS
jgi:hypothetical protein